jgi:Domain of unknown function (DUF1707)
MMPEPGDDRTARPAGRGRLRASHGDRDQVVDTLKDAFVQGRLTKDEFDARVGRALASRTHADLAALTTDLPAGPAGPRPQRAPRSRRPVNPTIKRGARVIAATTVLTGSVWAGAVLSNTDSQVLAALVWTLTIVWLGIVILVGAVMLESRHLEQSGRQVPPVPTAYGGGGRTFERGDPTKQLWPGNHRPRHAAEASAIPISRRSLLLGLRLSPS